LPDSPSARGAELRTMSAIRRPDGRPADGV
jgi:hypothetical protein